MKDHDFNEYMNRATAIALTVAFILGGLLVGSLSMALLIHIFRAL